MRFDAHRGAIQRKAQGAKLGNPRNIASAGSLGGEALVSAACQFAENLLPLVRAIQGTGAVTLEAISCALNERGVRPARGTRWYASSVANLLSRAQKIAAARTAARSNQSHFL